MSDDDRMSLTTAISDDDEIDDNMQNSSYRAKQSATAASFNCTGAVRKAGFLSVKKWILRKKHQVKETSKQPIKRVVESFYKNCHSHEKQFLRFVYNS